MMEIQLQFILITCVANLCLFIETITSDKVDVEREVRSENVQNLFDSIAKKNTQKSRTYRNILMQDEANRKKGFDSMKEELQIAQNRNIQRRKHQEIIMTEMKYIGGDTNHRHAVVKRAEDWEKDYDEFIGATTKKPPAFINPEHYQLYVAACNKSIELYQSQLKHVESVKEKYFQQLKTKEGTEIVRLYDYLFKCEDTIGVEIQFIKDNINVDADNFTGWTEPLEKLQLVKILHNWKELILAIDTQKGKDPPEKIAEIRKQALEAFDEIAPRSEIVRELMSKLPKESKEEGKKGKKNTTLSE